MSYANSPSFSPSAFPAAGALALFNGVSLFVFVEVAFWIGFLVIQAWRTTVLKRELDPDSVLSDEEAPTTT